MQILIFLHMIQDACILAPECYKAKQKMCLRPPLKESPCHVKNSISPKKPPRNLAAFSKIRSEQRLRASGEQGESKIIGASYPFGCEALIFFRSVRLEIQRLSFCGIRITLQEMRQEGA